MARATLADLISELSVVVAKGLPITMPGVAPILLELRSVYARAVVPSDSASRLHALNELLPRLIATLSDEQYRGATQMLFGLVAGTRRTTLTARRRQAADLLGYSVGHFRADIEDELLRAVAAVIHNDLLRYQSRVKRSSESLEPTGDTPRLGPEDLTHEEELVSRVWQHVYGLRAELIAFARLGEQDGYEAQAEDHRQAAHRQEDELRTLLQEYDDTYGEELIRHGEAEFSAQALSRLIGWRV